MNKAKRKKLMESADKILDEYNAGKITKEQMEMCMRPISLILRDEDPR